MNVLFLLLFFFLDVFSHSWVLVGGGWCMEPIPAACGRRQVHIQMSGQLMRALCEHFGSLVPWQWCPGTSLCSQNTTKLLSATGGWTKSIVGNCYQYQLSITHQKDLFCISKLSCGSLHAHMLHACFASLVTVTASKLTCSCYPSLLYSLSPYWNAMSKLHCLQA